MAYRDEQKINDLIEQRNQLEAKYGDLLEKSEGRSKAAVKNRRDRLALDQKITSEQKKQSKIEADREATGKDIDKTLTKAVKKQRELKVQNKDTFGMGQNVVKAASKNLEITKAQNKAGKIGNNLALKLNDIGEDLIGQNYDLEGIKSSQRDLDEELINAASEEAREAIRSQKETLGLESKRLKTQEVQKKAMAGLDKVTGGMASKTKDSLGFASKMGPALGGAFLAGGLVVGVVGGLIKALKFTSGLIDKLGAKFGVLGGEGSKFQTTMLDSGVNMIALGGSIDNAVNITDELTKNFGIGLQRSADISEKVFDTAKAIGLSDTEAAKLFGTFMSIGKLTLKQAEDLAESTYQLAVQNDVNPVAVMQDIADSAEMIAKFGADNVKQISKAAVEARKLGLSLKTVDKISDSMLNFQSSIQAEMEASVMIGKQLNFNEARRLFNMGKQSDAMKVILEQLGGEEEFNKLGIQQREALAKSIGVESTELAKLVLNQGKQVEQQETFNDLLGRDAMSALTSILSTFKMIGATVMNEFGKPLAEALDGLETKFFTKKRIDSIKEFITNIVENIKIVVKKAIDFGTSLSGAYKTFMGIMKLLRIIMFVSSLGTSELLFAAAKSLGGNGEEEPETVNDFRSAGGSHLVLTPSGQMLKTNPNDTVFGTTAVNDFRSGPAGSMPVGSKETNQKLDKQNELLETLINVTRGNPNALAVALGEA